MRYNSIPKPKNKFKRFVDNIDWESTIALTILGLIVLFIIWSISLVIIDAKYQAICLRNGFPTNHTTWNYVGYCVRTINQTQYVIPLKELVK